MDTKQLTYFMKVYEYKSINLASKALFISPQGLSKIIQKLEADLNITLFIRRSTGVIPTEAAKNLYAHAQNIINELNAINSELSTTAKRELVIGCTAGIIRMLTLKFLYDFQDEHPDIILRLYDNTDTALEQMLWNEELNLCFLSGPVNQIKYNASFFTTCKVCVITNIHNPLAQLSEITMKDLSNEPLVISSREFYAYQDRYNALIRTGSNPNIILETMDIDFHAISASQGYSSALSLYLPEFIGNYPNIKVIPFKNSEKYTWETYLVHKKDRKMADEENTFCSFALNWIQKNRPELTQK